MARRKNHSGVPAQVSADLLAQRAHMAQVEQTDFDFGLIVAPAFINGIRSLGYKSSATAIDELVDNAIQAEAENVHVIFDLNASGAKPERIAVLDDGHGMDPGMARLSVVWGGTHRENNRSGFGRFGYGLPSASMSMGRAFTVYSSVADGAFSKVTLDLDEITTPKYNQNGRITVPVAEGAQLPDWIAEYAGEFYSDEPLTHGTAVVIDRLDLITWKTTTALEAHLVEHMGMTYRNVLRQVNIFVNGKRVEPVDPLFITPGFRFYDLDADRAEPLPPLAIDVKDATGAISTINVRYAYLPPSFGWVTADKGKENGAKNARFPILKETNGIIVNRAGRQIDVLTRCPWTVFQNNDRYVKVEVDFPPTLDEEFQVTTSKQTVIPSERIWNILKEHGVYAAIQQMRQRSGKDRGYEVTRQDQDPNEKRPSERVMEESAKYKAVKPVLPVEKQQEVQRKLKLKAASIAEQLGVPVEDIEKELESVAQGRPYKVEIENLPGAPYYRMEQIGGQKILKINGRHRWYTEVYAAPDTTPRWRNALEVMLFVMGDAELDATEDRQRFYEVERSVWSGRLSIALDLLKDHIVPPVPANPDAGEGSPEAESVVAGKQTT
jgi:hypothetical protein